VAAERGLLDTGVLVAFLHSGDMDHDAAVRAVGGALLVPSSRPSLERCRTLLQQYDDLPADFADTTLVALAEETDTWTVLSLDRRDFSVYRGADGQRFEIRP